MGQNKADGAFSHTFSEILHKNLYHHLSRVEDMEMLRLSTICDPRYRKLAFRNPEKATSALEALKREMSLVRNVRSTVVRDERGRNSSSNPAKKAPSVWDSFDQEVEKSHTREEASSSDDIATEVYKYLRMRNLPRDKDPLFWWKEVGKELFPRIYQVARKYLLVLGSSVPSERIFSSAGLTITARRCNLDEGTAESCICIHENLKKRKRSPAGEEEDLSQVPGEEASNQSAQEGPESGQMDG